MRSSSWLRKITARNPSHFGSKLQGFRILRNFLDPFREHGKDRRSQRRGHAGLDAAWLDRVQAAILYLRAALRARLWLLQDEGQQDGAKGEKAGVPQHIDIAVDVNLPV